MTGSPIGGPGTGGKEDGMKQYMRTVDLAEEFGFSDQTVRKIVRVIQNNIGRGRRYSPMCIVGNGRSMLVRTVAFLDAAKYGEFLDGKYEPDEFDPLKLERECGILQIEAEPQPEIDTTALAKSVVEELLRAVAAAV